MKNDDVIKRYRSLFTSKEESNKTEGGIPFTDYWKTKEIEEFWLAEIKRKEQECYEQMSELINVSVASGEIDIIKHSFRSKLQALKEEL